MSADMVDATMLGQLVAMGFDLTASSQALGATGNIGVEAAVQFMQADRPTLSVSGASPAPAATAAAPMETATPPREPSMQELAAERRARAGQAAAAGGGGQAGGAGAGARITSRVIDSAAKHSYQDKERQRHIAQINKDKRGKAGEREKIKRRMAEDAENRQLAQQRGAQKQALMQTAQQAKAAAAASTAGGSAGAGKCRLQVRLPDGSAKVHTWPASTTLSMVVEFIASETELQAGAFTLVDPGSFPRRELGNDLETVSSSLGELNLVPSSSLIVMKSESKGQLAQGAEPYRPAPAARRMPAFSPFEDGGSEEESDDDDGGGDEGSNADGGGDEGSDDGYGDDGYGGGPNPDAMSYDQLQALEEEMGDVEKSDKPDPAEVERVAATLEAAIALLRPPGFPAELGEEEPEDEIACPLLGVALSAPVFLPTTPSQAVSLSALKECLKLELKDPFSREPIALADIVAHNATPEVQQQARALLQQVAEWVAAQ